MTHWIEATSASKAFSVSGRATASAVTSLATTNTPRAMAASAATPAAPGRSREERRTVAASTGVNLSDGQDRVVGGVRPRLG